MRKGHPALRVSLSSKYELLSASCSAIGMQSTCSFVFKFVKIAQARHVPFKVTKRAARVWFIYYLSFGLCVWLTFSERWLFHMYAAMEAVQIPQDAAERMKQFFEDVAYLFLPSPSCLCAV